MVEVHSRPEWGNKVEYMLTTIGYSVGIGNLLRFPYVCMENGGGAFLIPYFFFMLVCGVPLFLAEMSMGQFARLSVVGIWNFAPIFRGVGWCMVTISGFISIYYIMLLSWVLFYLISSFTFSLPWGSCNNTWNTKFCYTYTDIVNGNISAESVQEKINSSINWRSSAEEFYLFRMLKVTPSINEFYGMNWFVLLCFTISWAISVLCIIKSVKTLGKVVYVTAVLPYILITVFIVRGAMLPGSLEGVKFYIVPKWKTLLTYKVWITAACQIFYSLGPAWGGLIVMASYNKLNANLVRRSFVLTLICCLTSVYGGFAIFSVLGYMARILKVKDIRKVVDSGMGLAFIVYPQAMTLLPGGTALSICFFLTLYTLGLDSMFATYESFLQGIMDEFPSIYGYKKYVFLFSSTAIMMLLGLPFTTRAGGYLYQIIDWYSTPVAVIVIAGLEALVIAWFYNYKELIFHIELMMKKKMNIATRYWFISCMTFFTPVSLFAIFIGVLINFKEPTPIMGDSFPTWSINLGWTFAGLLILPIPLSAIWEVIKMRHNWKQVFRPNDKFRNLIKDRVISSDSSILEQTGL